MDQTRKPSRRSFLNGAAALSLGASLPLPALAQAYPTKPVRTTVVVADLVNDNWLVEIEIRASRMPK